MDDREYEPLTGDPDLLVQAASRYQEIAAAIQRSVAALGAVHDVDDMRSEAVAALSKTGDEVATDIQKAHDRYADTASALLVYAAGLRTAQQDARQAIAAIAAAGEDMARADAASSSAAHAAATARGNPATTPDAQDDADRAAGRAQAYAQNAADDLAAAQQRWRDARDAKNAAADVAFRAISDVVDKHNQGLKNPSWWEDALSWAHDALKVICDIAGVLAIFFAWVPFLGQALIVLAAVGALLDVLDAVVNVVNGSGNWWDVAFAVGTAAVTLFGGKLLTFAAKGLRARAIVNSGVRGERALARMQGMGRHSADLMKWGDATTQLQKPLHSVFTSPFVRDASQKAAFDAFRNGEKGAVDLIKQSAREAFPAFHPDPSKWLGLNDELANYHRLAQLHPELITSAMKKVDVAASVYQSASTTEKIINLPGKLMGDPAGAVIGTADGKWGTVGGAIKDGASLIPGLIRDAPHVFAPYVPTPAAP